jgi:hypothetical protein
MEIDNSTIAGIVVIIVAVFALVKAAKLVVKIAMAALVVVGFYLWFGLDAAEALLR